MVEIYLIDVYKRQVLEQLNKLKELVAAILPDKVRHKSQERDPVSYTHLDVYKRQGM